MLGWSKANFCKGEGADKKNRKQQFQANRQIEKWVTD
jgi:hypothetical protein